MPKPLRAAFRLIAAAIPLLCLCSCGEGPRVASASGLLVEGREDRASLSFPMNSRPVRVEVFLRLEGGKAAVSIDHPDGRTSETRLFEGSGVHQFRKELPKEPGSWCLGIEARGGAVAYWYAFHDSRSYLGIDDEARGLVALE